MKLNIVEVNNNSLENTFIDFQWKIYQNDPLWVPPLKLSVKDMLSKKHPFYKTAKIKMWLAYNSNSDDNSVVGRIAAITNQSYNSFQNEQAGFVGFFESIDNVDVALELFGVAENYLKLNGAKIIRGPMNPSTNYECGILVEGENDPPQLMMTYNPPYYKKLFESVGYSKAMDLYAYKLPTDVIFSQRLERIVARATKSDQIRCRNLSKKDWHNEITKILDIYNKSWEKNWGFVPYSEEEFRYIAKSLKSICREDLTFMVEVNGDPAGVLVALPDFNQVFKSVKNGKLFPFGLFKILLNEKNINRVRVPIMGVKSEYRKLGLAPMMYLELYRSFQRLGGKYKEVEMSWILETNKDMNKAIHIMGAPTPYKTYRIYQKSLDQTNLGQQNLQ
ncbi:MAG: N-acetyltransferase [Oligoflexia bacterium]|nr:N-acetyltransferase [Oligoflexia bacterium]